MKFFKENKLYCLSVFAFIVYTSYSFVICINTSFDSDFSGSMDMLFIKGPNFTIAIIYLIVFRVLAKIKKEKQKLYNTTSILSFVLIVLWIFC